MKRKKEKKFKIHSYVDYALAIMLIASPWLFNLEIGAMESKIMITIGIGLVLTNFITNHKFGLTKMFPVNIHYKIDMFFGWFLLVSPFLYGFFAATLFPHLLFGILIFANTFLIKVPINILSKRKFVQP